MPGSWQSWEHYVQTAQNQAKYGSGGTMQDIGHAILGGPGGMVNAALGQRNPISQQFNFNTHLAHTDLANHPQGKQIWESMNDAEQKAYENMDANQRAQFLTERARSFIKTPEQLAKDKEEADYQTWRKDTMARLDKFSKEMSMSVPELLAAGNLGVQEAQSAGQRAGAMQGLAAGSAGGGISNLNTQKAAMDSMNGFALQRQGLGLQATNQLMSMDEDRYRYNQNMNLQMQGANIAAYNQQYQQAQQQQAGLFGLAGTAVGAYFGGPQGAAVGGQLGMAAGGQVYGSQNPYTPPKYKQPSGLSGSGQTPYYGSQ